MSRAGSMCHWPCTGLPGRRCRSWPTKGIRAPASASSVPTKNPRPAPDEETRNNPLPALRAPAEREGAMFKHFKALQHVSLDPAAITTIMAAALVIITLRHESRHES